MASLQDPQFSPLCKSCWVEIQHGAAAAAASPTLLVAERQTDRLVTPGPKSLAGLCSPSSIDCLVNDVVLPLCFLGFCRGHETMVRFTNNMNSTAFDIVTPPCTGTRSGRPMAVHAHGSASLAAYDGWAEDNICFGERACKRRKAKYAYHPNEAQSSST